jgi:hypothetical protein
VKKYVLVVECISNPSRGIKAGEFGEEDLPRILADLQAQGYEAQPRSPRSFRRRATMERVPNSKASKIVRDEMLARIVNLEAFSDSRLEEVIT